MSCVLLAKVCGNLQFRMEVFHLLKKNYLVIQIIRNLITVIVTLSYMNEFAIEIQVLLQLVVLEWGLKMV